MITLTQEANYFDTVIKFIAIMSRVSESDTTTRPQNLLFLCFALYLRYTLNAWKGELLTSYQDYVIQIIIVITLTNLAFHHAPAFFQNCGRYSL